MNRVNKKLKTDASKSSFGRSSNTNGSSIHSGHYMTSYLHDQNEDTVEMPIASPDAMNNDVTLNTNLNTDQDNFHDAENELQNQNSVINNKNQALVSNIATKNLNNMTGIIAKKTMTSGPFTKIQTIIGSGGSISGGLTLDKNNKSLKNLMFYIKSAYSNNLTSPKWKNFKGLKLQVTEKIRLNNVIWRSWFEQYGKKETSNVKLRLICQFANGLEEKPISQKMSKREGKFWKARLESITNEYKKWREISRRQIKACDSGDNLKSKELQNRQTPNIYQTNVNNATSTLSSSYGPEQPYFDNFQSNFTQSQQPQNQNCMYPPSNFSVSNEFSTDFNVQSNIPNESNFSSYGPNTPQNISSYNNFGIPQNSNFQVNNNYPVQTSNVTTTSYSSQIPIASKQMPYNNRCRSPSPGLFDFDFNNFSSDTLFSTHFVEDPKDTIFGTNPDFFQPDLMHLFPNFDFFDLPGNNSDVFNLNNNTETNSEQNSPQATSNSQIVSDSNTPIQYNPQSTETVSVVEIEDVNKQVHQPPISIAIDYSDLSNFDTLATVAAAQSINVSPNASNAPQPNRPIRQRHMSDISEFNHLKNNSDQTIINDVNNQIKMPVSLSQINSSLTINPIQTQYSLSSTNIATQPLRRPSSSQIQSPQSNTSSNTIRNLLALNTPTVSLPPSISPPKQPTSNNMRISGILGVTGSSIPPIRKQVAPQKVIYQQETLPNLIQNSTPSSQQNIVLLSSDNNKIKTDNLTISNLLTSSVILPQQVQQKAQQDINQILNHQEQFIDQTKPPPSKRGRKSINEISCPRPNSKSIKPPIQTKIKKDDSQSPQINVSLVIPETVENINSPTISPNQKISSYNSFQNSAQNYSNSDASFSDFSSKYRVPSSFSKETTYQSGRINRSDSLNSVNTETTISTAEQKRRCNIQQGFDRLQILVPALKDGKNLKVSKAVMLQKTSEYIKELQTARDKRMNDLEVYRKEIEILSDKITECQNQLPANGVGAIGNLNKTEIFEQKFNSYVKEKTIVNWKFYLFSLILKPLFDNFLTTVNTSSKEDMEKTFHEWQQKYCSLAQLRPMASNALRNLSRTTSILTDPNKLPEECYSSALSRI